MTEYVIAPLTKAHQRAGFRCSQPALDDFLRRYALQQQSRHLNKTYAACVAGGDEVAGYYTLSAASIGFMELPDTLQKSLARYPVPAVRIGRLAVDERHQGQGLGKRLLAHALHRVADVADTVGVAVVLVDAKDEKAADFYRSMGFTALEAKPLTLFLPVAQLLKARE